MVITTDSRHGFPVYPNRLADVLLSAPDQAWVADFTYIRLRNAFVYLACILDAYSRRCVGWHLSRDMTIQLTRCALHHAIAERHQGQILAASLLPPSPAHGKNPVRYRLCFLNAGPPGGPPEHEQGHTGAGEIWRSHQGAGQIRA